MDKHYLFCLCGRVYTGPQRLFARCVCGRLVNPVGSRLIEAWVVACSFARWLVGR